MALNSIYKVSEWTQIVLLLLMYFVHYSHRYNSYFLYLITPQLKKNKSTFVGWTAHLVGLCFCQVHLPCVTSARVRELIVTLAIYFSSSLAPMPPLLLPIICYDRSKTIACVFLLFFVFHSQTLFCMFEWYQAYYFTQLYWLSQL